VAGMMIYICVSQLIPGAHKYDPDDKLAAPFLVLGMAVMAASVLLFLV
jgi:zinc transporter ZupT